MAQYKNGIETKNRILQTAKELFYKHGFQKTTIAMIAEKASVPVGLVNYYYKKEELIGKIHYNLTLSINKVIDEQLSGKIENHLQKHVIYTHLFYRKIGSDPVNKNLYHTIIEKNLVAQETHDYVRSSMMAIISEFNLSIEMVVFKKMMIAEYGAREALLIDAFKQSDFNLSNDFINFLATITVRLTGISTMIIEDNIKKAEKLLPLVDTSSIYFFDS
ncbi:MAG: TetR/AcrR family transcriptional regulator [Eubacterium sp.]